MPSSQKLQIWLKPNCTWMFIGWSSTNFTYPTGTKNRNFVEDHPRNIPAKFGSNWSSGFGEEAWHVKSLQTTDDGRQVMAIVHMDLWIWLPGPIICSDWLKFQRSSSLKLMNWLNPNSKWMIIGMSITNFLFFSDGNSSHGPLVQVN
jgi:hypothetical protein